MKDREGANVDYKASYKKAYEDVFSKAVDVNNLYGEQNYLRYLPLDNIALRLFPGDTLEQAEMVVQAAKTCKVPVTVSADIDNELADKLTGCKVVKESLNQFIDGIAGYERIRTCSPDIDMSLYEAAAYANKYVATAPPVKEGRVELTHYIKEQSVSYEYHRYGSITDVPPIE